MAIDFHRGNKTVTIIIDGTYQNVNEKKVNESRLKK